MILARVVVFCLGAILVGLTVFSAVRTFVLPRSASDPFTRLHFRTIRRIFNFFITPRSDYIFKDRVLALYAPVALVALVPYWLSLVVVGYAGMLWAIGISEPRQAFIVSGSSLFTLGFAAGENLLQDLCIFTEATLGMTLIALLIAYLPSIYAAFSRREEAVSMLEVRAGSPPSAEELILRYHRIHGLDRLGSLWQSWENWFTHLEESHTSLAALVFFRSPQPHRSWVNAAGAILDAAALTRAALDVPRDARADLCIRAGYLALRSIAAFFNVRFHPDPHYPAQHISVTRQEFDVVIDRLAAAGTPLKPDRDQAWADFAGWRVNYDAVLVALARITVAPPAPWIQLE